MASHEIWKLIKLHVTGSIRPHERLLLKRWMDQHPDNRKLVADVQQGWANMQDQYFDVDVDQAWLVFLRKRGHYKTAVSNKQGKTPLYPALRRMYRGSRSSTRYMLRLAAILLVAFLAGLFVYIYTAESVSEQYAAQLVMEELVTANGEKARVTFSDGTQVTLNAASSLSFPKAFRDSKRVVYLEGEAYFKVVPNSEIPFIVQVQGVDIEVLGTQFNVRGWAQDPGVDVVVREGKVSVEATDPGLEGEKSVILTAGLQTSVMRGNVPQEPREVDIKNKLVWLNGGLHFENAPFRSVVRDLERRFNVQIQVEDEDLLDLLFTSTFQYAQLNEILNVISGAMGIEYRQVGSEIIFS